MDTASLPMYSSAPQLVEYSIVSSCPFSFSGRSEVSAGLLSRHPRAGNTQGVSAPERDRIPGSTNFRNQRCTWEVAMPVYDYICNDCNKSFETVLTLGEHDAENIKCPKCGSKNVEQEMAAVFAVTSKKS